MNTKKLLTKKSFTTGNAEYRPPAGIANTLELNMAIMLLTEIMKCEMKYDKEGHGYLRVPLNSPIALGHKYQRFWKVK